jgi:hypothetical protein
MSQYSPARASHRIWQSKALVDCVFSIGRSTCLQPTWTLVLLAIIALTWAQSPLLVKPTCTLCMFLMRCGSSDSEAVPAWAYEQGRDSAHGRHRKEGAEQMYKVRPAGRRRADHVVAAGQKLSDPGLTIGRAWRCTTTLSRPRRVPAVDVVL